MSPFTTIDYHVTSSCNQECLYCWGPQDFDNEADTATAAEIVRKIHSFGAKRIVYTGGDPLLRSDIGLLIRLAKELGLEVALSTTGDELDFSLLRGYGRWIDLISLPIDGPTEGISSRTKKPGHFENIMRDLDLLKDFPYIDVKMATPVTRHNISDVSAIVELLDEYAGNMDNRFFYNVFQAFPRAMSACDWDDLIVSDEAFSELRKKVEKNSHQIKINWLDHNTLDRLYVMIFPDGTLCVPSGSEYLNYGPVLEIEDLEALLGQTNFDSSKHQKHSRGWTKTKKESKK
jgi:MoaA/NifB/PqqE/SkfB family radical SAM enzyme